MKVFFTFCSILLLISCSQTSKETASLGEAELEVSGSEEAKGHFNRGLLLLHSFEYEDARDAFRAAIRVDSSMAMAYWGEAMTFNHPIWHRQEPDSARLALDRGVRAGAQPISDLEADFLESLEVLYEEGLAKEYRDQQYVEFLEEMAQNYPKNHEVQSFYSLALLGSVQDGRNLEVYEKAGRIASGVVDENPNHPGALHYVIHSYDDPSHAGMAMDAATTYAKVAPDASHALHMPSHIFVAKGMWDEVIASNIDSYGASVKRMELKELDNDARGYHAYHWLQYGYLQKSEFEKAASMVDSMVGYIAETPSKRGRAHLVMLKGTYLIESGDWNSSYADIETEVSDLNIRIRSKDYFMDAMKAFHSEDIENINLAAENLQAEIRREAVFLDTVSFKLCIPSDRSEAKPSDLATAQATYFQILGLRGWLNNKPLDAEKYLRAACDVEDSLSYSFGPPAIQKPTGELYADWLMVQGRFGDARAEYIKVLSRAPGRRLAEMGKKAALKGADSASLAKR